MWWAARAKWQERRISLLSVASLSRRKGHVRGCEDVRDGVEADSGGRFHAATLPLFRRVCDACAGGRRGGRRCRCRCRVCTETLMCNT
jgi:hypothetical protein